MAKSPVRNIRDSNEPTSLEAIAETVRGSFQTVEDMTQSFIREAIVQGVFLPGERLNLDKIAKTLGVSRMPVRASLRQLEGEGLVRMSAYRGATVSVLRPDEIAEIYELRILLESHLLRRAMERIDEPLVDRLEAIVAELETSEELGARLELRRAFYQALYEHAERPRALAQVNNLRGSVGRYLLLQRVDEHHGHQELIGLIRAGDADAATEWLAQHLCRVSGRLQGMVARDQSVAAAEG